MYTKARADVLRTVTLAPQLVPESLCWILFLVFILSVVFFLNVPYKLRTSQEPLLNTLGYNWTLADDSLILLLVYS